jgi:phosphate transport system substrate-binding protein
MLKRKSIPLVMSLTVLALVASPQLGFRGWQFSSANAQTETSQQFQLPANVPSNTIVRIAGSDTMAKITETLKQGFEKQYQGTKVEVTPGSADAALRAVMEGRADVATIGRPLTKSEQAQGLVAHPIARHKIAIVTSANNPFNGSITSEQFAKIFRGEMKNWSEIGGHDSAIRLVDQTPDSDTRQAFNRYPVFQSAPFESAATASKLADNKVETIVNNLGNDGISYVIADQAIGRSDVQILPLHKVMPTDQRYPFSQALSYVYKGPNPNEAVKSFLGYANAPAQNTTIEQARLADAKGTGTVIAGSETQPNTTAQAEKTGIAPATTQQITRSTQSLPMATQKAKHNWWGWLPWLALASLSIPLLGWLLYGAKDKERRHEERDDRHDVSADRLDNIGVGERSTTTTHRPSMAGSGLRGAATVGTAAVGAAGLAGAAAMATVKTPASRIILVPKDCQNAYAYWEIPDSQKSELRQRGGQRLQVRLYDMSDKRAPHLVQQFDCSEQNPDLPIPIALDDHDYQVEIGYLAENGNWLKLATSNPVKVPACERPTVSDRTTQPQIERPIDRPVARQGDIFPPVDEAPTQPPRQPVPQQPTAQAGTANPNQAILLGGAGAAAGVAAGMAHHHQGERPVPTEWQTDPQHQRSQPESSRVILVPRSADSAYAYWEIPEAQQQAAKHQGGQRLAVRLYDVTEIDAQHPTPIHFQQFDCNDKVQDLHMAIAKGDREYVAEVGYLTQDNRWLRMGRSSRVRMSGMGMERTVTLDNHTVPSRKAMAEVPEGRLVIMSRIPQRITVGAPSSDEPRAYIYWDIPESRKQSLKPQGTPPLVLQVYDATDIDLDQQPAHSFRQYVVEENARDMVVSVPLNDRDYVAEIGYLMPDGKLQRLVRSMHTHVKTDA